MKRVQPTIMQPQHNTIMRRVIQPRDNSQTINTVNKVSNLSNITVSSSNNSSPATRVVRQTIYASPQVQSHLKCFICDENIMGAPTSLKETETSTSREKVTKKLARLVGDEFCVVVSEEDVICRRCLTLFNTMDKYESDIQGVKTRLRGFINKKYGIDDAEEPPVKIQRLSDTVVHSSSSSSSNNNNYRWQNNIADESPTRKIPVASVNKETAESQLKHLANTKQRGPVKLYKCIACDFKTTDLNAFQPHSSVCKGQQQNQQQQQQQLKANTIISPQNRVNRVTTYPTNSPQQKAVTASPPVQQQVGRTTIIRSNSTQFSCQQCEYKTSDRNLFADHQRNHMKLRPFKCRMCLERFATREAAQTHAKIHSGNGMKCGICNRQFIKREVFEAHMKTHEKFKTVSQQEVIVMNKESTAQTVQKPLTDIIKEALSEEDQDAVNEFIEFHSCNLCSLTFVNKKLYAQHMKTHESPSSVNRNANEETQTAYGKGKSQITEGDLESIFEKMHSENVTISNGSNGNENILITTQDSGGITYNITIPQDDIPHEEKKVRIDMPNLDDTGDDSHKNETEQTLNRAPVSMPSLHDDENTQSSQEQQQSAENQQGDQAIPMDLEELQQAEGQQLKFIVDENGQFLQLDNHILTTDAEGNQILVQGTNQEQLQHLLQSVGVDGNQVLVQLQGNGEEGIDGEGATLQFGEGGQGQMILVQNENGESQLIDASMLQTEGGNLVLQQGADGETTLTTADGIPVSVSFSGEGADGQITVTMAGTGEDGQQIFIQQPVELAEGQEQVQNESETTMQLEDSSQESSTVPEAAVEGENNTVAAATAESTENKSNEAEAKEETENQDTASKDDEKESEKEATEK